MHHHMACMTQARGQTQPQWPQQQNIGISLLPAAHIAYHETNFIPGRYFDSGHGCGPGNNAFSQGELYVQCSSWQCQPPAPVWTHDPHLKVAASSGQRNYSNGTVPREASCSGMMPSGPAYPGAAIVPALQFHPPQNPIRPMHQHPAPFQQQHVFCQQQTPQFDQGIPQRCPPQPWQQQHQHQHLEPSMMIPAQVPAQSINQRSHSIVTCQSERGSSGSMQEAKSGPIAKTETLSKGGTISSKGAMTSSKGAMISYTAVTSLESSTHFGVKIGTHDLVKEAFRYM